MERPRRPRQYPRGKAAIRGAEIVLDGYGRGVGTEPVRRRTERRNPTMPDDPGRGPMTDQQTHLDTDPVNDPSSVSSSAPSSAPSSAQPDVEDEEDGPGDAGTAPGPDTDV